MPPIIRKEISISSDAFDEMTGALTDAGIKLEKDDEFTVKKDMAIKGPILYRQVNLRHQVLIEIVKVYKTPLDADGVSEINDATNFINFLDATYQYILKGEVPTQTDTPETIKPKASGWGNKG